MPETLTTELTFGGTNYGYGTEANGFRRKLLWIGENDAWLNEAVYDDFSVVIDFVNNRYAMPALDSGGQPILARVGGKFPKRVVGVADVLAINRYTLATPTPPFAIAPWYAYSSGSWGLIGGDGLGVGVPRLESWLGAQAMYVEPNQRFNRIPNAETLAGGPRTTNPTRSWVYTVSWVGMNDLVCICNVGGIQTTTLPASGTGFNWGILPIIPGWAGEGTTFTSTSGFSMQLDTHSNAVARPPTSMIATAAGTFVDGPFSAAHVDRSPEHVRFSTALMDLIKVPATDRMRTGTIIVDQQQLMEPQTGGRRLVLGGGTDWASATPSYMAFHENAGSYTVQFQTGDHNGDLSFATTAAGIKSRAKLGLTVQYSAATPWTNQKRAGFNGAASSTVADNPVGLAGNPTFWLNSGRCESATDTPGVDNAGMGAWNSIMWSPEFFSAATMQAKTTL